ncbi:MAG: hypothetical protein B7Z25_07405 [Aerococcus viridans]|nr:MAG: hypothetical protein B7Z25_07405 [Aerococcus viridans]
MLVRLQEEAVEEVIVATNATAEGEATATYLSGVLTIISIRSLPLPWSLPCRM